MLNTNPALLMISALTQYATRVLGLFRSRTARDAGYVLGGNLGSALLRFAVAVMLARVLAPDAWAYLVVFMTLMDMVATFCDAGINSAMVKHVAAAESQSPLRLIMRFLLFKAAITAVVVIALFAGTGYVLGILELPVETAWAYPCALLAGVVLSLNTFNLAIFQAFQRFPIYAIGACVINLLRVAILGTMIFIGIRETTPLYLAFFLAPIAAVGLTSAALVPPLRHRRPSPPAPVDNRAILRFMAPLALLSVVTIAIQRIDVLMLQALTADPHEVGNYGVAAQVAFVFPLITGALFSALLPKVSAKKSREQLRDYRQKILYLYPVILVATALGVAIAPLIVLVLFGETYAGAIPVLRMLILAFGLHIIFNPLGLIFYSLGRPGVITSIHLIQLPFVIILNFLLIPPLGALGATVAALLIRVFGVAAIVWLTGAALREPS